MLYEDYIVDINDAELNHVNLYINSLRPGWNNAHYGNSIF